MILGVFLFINRYKPNRSIQTAEVFLKLKPIVVVPWQHSLQKAYENAPLKK